MSEKNKYDSLMNSLDDYSKKAVDNVNELSTNIKKIKDQVLEDSESNLKEIKEVTISDYHLTPMDYYCHDSIDIGKKNRLDIPFIEGKDRILASTVSHLPETPLVEVPKEVEKVDDVPSKKEDDIPEKGYTQISIFDDDDDF